MASLLLREIPRIRRRLILAGRHQQPLRAQVIGIIADLDHGVLGRTGLLVPDRLRIGIAPVGAVLGPRPRQGMVERRDVVVEQILVGLVEIDALLDDGLIVGVERDALRIIGVRRADKARLDSSTLNLPSPLEGDRVIKR